MNNMMKNIKNYLINEVNTVRWYPERYEITSNEDAIKLIVDLFSSSKAPEILAEAWDDGNFDYECFHDSEFLEKLGQELGDVVNERAEEL